MVYFQDKVGALWELWKQRAVRTDNSKNESTFSRKDWETVKKGKGMEYPIFNGTLQ